MHSFITGVSYNCLPIAHLVSLNNYQFITVSLDVRLQNSSVPHRKYYMSYNIMLE